MSAAPLSADDVVGIVGAGTMGAGIAQVAAAAGHRVRLFDAVPGAAKKGRDQLAEGLKGLVARGKMAVDVADALVGRIEVADDLASMSDTALVIEAIVEDLEVKRTLFSKLESITGSATILATNTSSISVTSIARGLRHPGRLVGMHFFNPATVMRLVEVIRGVSTAVDVADRVFATATAWGKVAVHARSTPGFIVNRVARAYYGEPLRLFEEGVAEPATLDALFTGSAGFKMGPFELMDLIGNDVNYAVSASVFAAYHGEPRFRPSLLQLELVNAGRLGRKSGQGFYDYAAGAGKPAPATVEVAEAQPFDALPLPDGREVAGLWIGLTDGRTADERAAELGVPVILGDLTTDRATRLGFATSRDFSEDSVSRFVATLSARGMSATRLPDWPGLVVVRTLAMIANEGFEAVLQGVADEAGVDAAMRFGVNYPKGPMQWAREIGLERVLKVLDRIHAATGDPRYRASYGLRRAVAGV